MPLIFRDPHRRVEKAPINCDPICPGQDPKFSGYNRFYIITGSPGSGKTNLLYDMIVKDKFAYKNKFDSIIFINASKTIEFPKNMVYELDDLDTDELLETINELKGDNICLILDDVVSDIKKSDKSMGKIVRNRRHLAFKKYESITLLLENGEELIVDNIPCNKGSLTIFLMTQVYNDIPLKFRKLSHDVIMFKPDFREFDIIKNELLRNYITKKNDKEFFMEIWKKAHDFVFINKTKKKIYKNWGEIIIE